MDVKELLGKAVIAIVTSLVKVTIEALAEKWADIRGKKEDKTTTAESDDATKAEDDDAATTNAESDGATKADDDGATTTKLAA